MTYCPECIFTSYVGLLRRGEGEEAINMYQEAMRLTTHIPERQESITVKLQEALLKVREENRGSVLKRLTVLSKSSAGSALRMSSRPSKPLLLIGGAAIAVSRA